MFGKPFAEQVRRGKARQAVQTQNHGNLPGGETADLDDERLDVAVCGKVRRDDQYRHRIQQHQFFPFQKQGQAA